MRFQGETTVDLQNSSRPPQPPPQQPQQQLTKASTAAPPGASNGVLLNAVQKDLESKYFNLRTVP